MSLSAKYKAFLASPSSEALADNVSLHYITTLTTINDAPAVIKHLTVQEKVLKKKEQKVLSAIEGSNGLSVDVETTIEFVCAGGAYLPGLDDNFLSDRIVTLPVVHIVHFDDAQKIVQMRQYWDQGSLLKQIEVIGARARNWPIRDGKDQIRLISQSVAHTPQTESAASSRPSTAARGEDEVSISERPLRGRTNNPTNDPHASLSLFENRQVEEEGEFESHPIASRAQSAKPPPRELSELFVGGEPGTPTPKNGSGVPGKAGGGKNFKPNRLFDEEELPAPTPMSIKTHAKKYDHFEFGEGEDTPKVRETARPVNKKHQSQWDFEDFVTPEKTKTKILGQNVRHFGWSDDEEEGSPVHREVVHKPRRDADVHFEFKDDEAPQGVQQKPFTSKGRQHNNGLDLYKDHVMGGDEISNQFDTPKGDNKGPLNDVTHIRNDIRQKDFGAHWEMQDDSPGTNKAANNGKKLTQGQEKVLKTMDANWGNYEPSPEQQKIKIAGNGMGGRRSEAQWSLYEEDADQSKKENSGIKSMGNGMGGRKGSEFNWDF